MPIYSAVPLATANALINKIRGRRRYGNGGFAPAAELAPFVRHWRVDEESDSFELSTEIVHIQSRNDGRHVAHDPITPEAKVAKAKEKLGWE